MTDIVVVGGYYGERCVAPDVHERFGSGGRAAIALAAAGREVRWHYYCPVDEQAGAAMTVAHDGLTHTPVASDTLVRFRYVHPLSRPQYDPDPLPVEKPIEVAADHVLRFGFMEGDAVVRAEACVYDPQAREEPAPFAANGSHANRLAVVLNAEEVLRYAAATDETTAIARLFGEAAPTVVVVKDGTRGCRIYEAGALSGTVPPFRSERVYKIGTGDVFSAAFVENWMLQGRPSMEAAEIASRCVAHYAQIRLPVVDEAQTSTSLKPVPPGDAGLVYVAGPFFTMQDLWLVEEAVRALTELGVPVFSPYHEVGLGPPEVVVHQDLAALDRAAAVLALLDGSDPGTLFEIGHASGTATPVVVLAQNPRPGDLTMLRGSQNCWITDDFATAVYRAAWAARR